MCYISYCSARVLVRVYEWKNSAPSETGFRGEILYWGLLLKCVQTIQIGQKYRAL